MILSMTGFGRSEGVFKDKKITVDLKSLNSKGLDINLKIPYYFKSIEFPARKILNSKVKRGKVDCFINVEILDQSNDTKINKELVESYIKELEKISPHSPRHIYLEMAMRLPDAVSTKLNELEEDEANFVLDLVKKAADQLHEFRTIEGSSLEKVLKENINTIGQLLDQVEPYEKERLENVKERYLKSLKEFETIDENRYYQEIAFFAEKLDIGEEKVRLAQHLKYYDEVMQEDKPNGKKLGFIAQEIGREINTLGSKANHSAIQKIVVIMKDELEKIKEQNLNCL